MTVELFALLNYGAESVVFRSALFDRIIPGVEARTCKNAALCRTRRPKNVYRLVGDEVDPFSAVLSVQVADHSTIRGVFALMWPAICLCV